MSKTESMIPVPCRLCGDAWKLPKYMAEQVSADKPWECPNCRALNRKLPVYGAIEEATHMIRQYAIKVVSSVKVFPKYFDTLEEAEGYRKQRSDPDHWEVVSRTVTYGNWEKESN